MEDIPFLWKHLMQNIIMLFSKIILKYYSNKEYSTFVIQNTHPYTYTCTYTYKHAGENG